MSIGIGRVLLVHVEGRIIGPRPVYGALSRWVLTPSEARPRTLSLCTSSSSPCAITFHICFGQQTSSWIVKDAMEQLVSYNALNASFTMGPNRMVATRVPKVV